MSCNYSIVIPTIARPSLWALLESLATGEGPLPERIVIVDDRTGGDPLDRSRVPHSLAQLVEIVRSGGRGPAAARNCGWRATSTPWVVFVDDDVLVRPGWRRDLERDLAAAPANVGGIQGRIDVPLPVSRPATDWERNVRGLMQSVWITADMAYRREVLLATGGFDERFKRAYREDADLALRAKTRGYGLGFGTREALHPVRPADPWISIRLQRGNADDVLMRALHGPRWRTRAGSPRGRFLLHAATVAAAGVAIAGAVERRKGVALLGAGAWLALTADFAWRRVAPGPRTKDEVVAMTLTSAVIPFAAVYHKVRGFMTVRRLLRAEAA